MKKTGKRILSIGLSMVVSAAIFISTAIVGLAYTETTGTVSSDNVKVRESPSTTATQVSSVNKGHVVEIVDEATDSSGAVWYKIRVNKNEYGYVRSDLVSKEGGPSTTASTTSTNTDTTTNTTTTDNSSAATLPDTTVSSTDTRPGTITEASVNVREGAGTAYNSVGKVKRGEVVTITGEATGTDSKTWYQITFGNNKQGYVRSDLLTVNDVAPSEGGDAAGGEGAEGAEGEGDFSGDQSQAGSAVTSEAGDGTYSLVYITDEEGNSVWYLYDNVEGYRVKVAELIEAARSSDEVNKLVKTNNTYKTILIVLAIVCAALVLGVILLALKLRDSLYYEEEVEEEYDRYDDRASRRRARDDDEKEESPRIRRGDPEERTVRPSRETADNGRNARPQRNQEEAQERTSRPRREEEDRASRMRREDEEMAKRSRRPAEDFEDDRASRRGRDERPARPQRRDQEEERADRSQRRPSSYRSNDAQAAEPEAPKRKTRNFIGDEDEFEFEFLDLDDDK